MAVRNAHVNFDDLDIAGKIERWERVLHVLLKMTPHQIEKHFDMSTWGYKTSCGTIGCAAGHCGLDPWFHRRGFKMSFTEHFPGSFSVSWKWGMHPVYFFGAVGYKEIFTNRALWSIPLQALPPKKSHLNVVKAVRRYIAELKNLQKSAA